MTKAYSKARESTGHLLGTYCIFSEDLFFNTGTFIPLIRLNVVLGMDQNSKTHLEKGESLK